MARTQLQRGPATDHYHTALGVDQSPGGGAIAVDNTVDPPAEVTTIIAPGADVSTPGEASLADTVSIRRRTLTLTNDQIKALPSAGFEIVAAQGAGIVIRPILVTLVSNFTAVYTNVNAGFHLFIYDGAGDVAMYGPADTFVNSTTRKIMSLGPLVVTDDPLGFGVAQLLPRADAVNQPLTLYSSNSGGAYTGGNAANTLKVTTHYILVDAA